MRHKHYSEHDQLELFRTLPGDLAPFYPLPETSHARSHPKCGGQPVKQRVLSGTAILVPSRIGSSCYRGLESGLSHCFPALCSRRNQKSFGFLLTGAADRVGHDRQQRLANRADVHNPGSPSICPSANAGHRILTSRTEQFLNE